MKEVFNKDDAMAFFIETIDENVLCVEGDRELEVDCYLKAESFFDGERYKPTFYDEFPSFKSGDLIIYGGEAYVKQSWVEKYCVDRTKEVE